MISLVGLHLGPIHSGEERKASGLSHMSVRAENILVRNVVNYLVELENMLKTD
jgi:hypothetical protein